MLLLVSAKSDASEDELEEDVSCLGCVAEWGSRVLCVSVCANEEEEEEEEEEEVEEARLAVDSLPCALSAGCVRLV